VPKSSMRGATPPLPQYTFMACCTFKKAQGQVTLLQERKGMYIYFFLCNFEFLLLMVR